MDKAHKFKHDQQILIHMFLTSHYFLFKLFEPSTAPPQPDPPLLCVLSPEPSLSSPRIADQESWLKDNQGRLDGSLHQQGRHEEEALLEARLKVHHHVQG